MDRRMYCGGVLLTVDDGYLPSAATGAAKAPASATTGGVGQISGAAWAGTFAYRDASQSSRAVEHTFGNRTARIAESASLRSEAKISEIGRTDPPAQFAGARGDLQYAGTGFDGSNLHYLSRVDIFTRAGRVTGWVVVDHSVGCM